MGTARHRKQRNHQVRVKAGSVLLAGSLTGALATGAVNGAPVADATCFSAFGINNGNGCTSNLTTIAIGIGEGATAEASLALFSGAISIGNNASAAAGISAFTAVMASGANATASALFSFLSALGQFGPGTTSAIGGPNIALGSALGGLGQVTAVIGGFNVAAQLGPGSTEVVGLLNAALGLSPGGNGQQNTVVGLLANVGINVFGNSVAFAQGVIQLALNVANQQLWPPPVLVQLINTLFPALAPKPAAPAPTTLLAAQVDGSSEQGASDTESNTLAAVTSGGTELTTRKVNTEKEAVDAAKTEKSASDPDPTLTEQRVDPVVASVDSVETKPGADPCDGAETKSDGDSDGAVAAVKREDKPAVDHHDGTVDAAKNEDAAKNANDAPAATTTGSKKKSGTKTKVGSAGDAGEHQSKDSDASANASE